MKVIQVYTRSTLMKNKLFQVTFMLKLTLTSLLVSVLLMLLCNCWSVWLSVNKHSLLTNYFEYMCWSKYIPWVMRYTKVEKINTIFIYGDYRQVTRRSMRLHAEWFLDRVRLLRYVFSNIIKTLQETGNANNKKHNWVREK